MFRKIINVLYIRYGESIKSDNSKNIIDFKHAATIDLSEESEFIRDIYDSELYRTFLETVEGKSILDGKGFTMSISTDGCNPSDKSKISIWPIYLTINEIPIGQRYCLDNIIIAGIFIYYNIYTNR